MSQNRRAIWALVAAVVAIAAAPASPAHAQQDITAESLTDEHVQKAIAALVDALYARKHADRFWDPERTPSGESKRQGGGYTALAVLALLTAGQSYQEPRLRDAVEHLATLDMQGTYAITTRALLWAKLPPRFHEQLAADAKTLVEGFNPKTGGWDYVPNPRANYHDNSIRQFGALSLWEAAKRNVPFDRRIWQSIEDTFINLQRPDGGWNYKADDPTTGSMTAAGLATLFITQDLLHAADDVPLRNRTPSRHGHAIERGMGWMDKHFSASSNPGKGDHFFYYLYGVERVGLASGYKRFGGHDWFREGAAELINDVCRWEAVASSFTLRNSSAKTGDLAFALMFLSRGRVPVAINKLKFDGAWNNRPRDVANLTRWIGEHSESALNWQIVDINAEPESWLDAPVLYVASHEPPPWMKDAGDVSKHIRAVREYEKKKESGTLTPEDSPPDPPHIPELDKLKRYLDLGGMIFAANEGTTRRFAESIEDAGLLMYPRFEWRNLPDDHWAYAVHMPVKGRRPQLRGLSNGVRELIILSPGGDLPATFQVGDEKQPGFLHTLANIYFYASDMNRSRPRLARHFTTRSGATGGAPCTIVRAMYEGNWNPEPLSLEVFAQFARDDRGMNAKIVEQPLATIHTMEPKPSLVIVSGIEQHVFTAAQIESIKAHVDAGGMMLFETPGGRGTFTASAEQMAVEVFGATIDSAIGTPVISANGLKGAKDLTQLEYRAFSLQSFGTRETASRLRCMTITTDRGPQLFFSREDISNALLDQPRWGVSGYSPQSARDLLANILQFAVSSNKSP